MRDISHAEQFVHHWKQLVRTTSFPSTKSASLPASVTHHPAFIPLRMKCVCSHLRSPPPLMLFWSFFLLLSHHSLPLYSNIPTCFRIYHHPLDPTSPAATAYFLYTLRSKIAGKNCLESWSLHPHLAFLLTHHHFLGAALTEVTSGHCIFFLFFYL